jgi:hypothetical protein
VAFVVVGLKGKDVRIRRQPWLRLSLSLSSLRLNSKSAEKKDGEVDRNGDVVAMIKSRLRRNGANRN